MRIKAMLLIVLASIITVVFAFSNSVSFAQKTPAQKQAEWEMERKQINDMEKKAKDPNISETQRKEYQKAATELRKKQIIEGRTVPKDATKVD